MMRAGYAESGHMLLGELARIRSNFLLGEVEVMMVYKVDGKYA